MHGVELIGTVTSVKDHPGMGVFHRKANTVKFNSKWVLTSKRRTETRFVTKSGETRTLDIVMGVEVEGKLVLLI